MTAAYQMSAVTSNVWPEEIYQSRGAALIARRQLEIISASNKAIKSEARKPIDWRKSLSDSGGMARIGIFSFSNKSI